MAGSNVLKEDRVTSTIHIINGLVHGLTHKRQAKKADTDYFVFAGNTVDIAIKMIQNRAAKDAIVVDDLGLQIVDRLYQEGLKSITLILTRIPKEHLALISGLIKRTFPNIKFDIKHLEEIDYMKTDLLISNPPYGAIGANITDTLRQKIDYEEFINLLPANDYKRNKTKDLFKYQSDMEAINDGFTDAAVTTHAARIHKGTTEDPALNINMTLDEFERSQYVDKSLNRYFEENSKRTHYAIDNPDCGKRPDLWDLGKTFVIGFRDMNHKHLPYKKTSATYLWNVLKNITWKYFVENFNNPRADRKGAYEVSFYGINFKSEKEFKNFVEFIYSKNGFRFMSKIFTALNVDGFIALNKFMPKVDWTRSWTVEELLADYGYDEKGIQDIMDSLDQFKGMED